MKLQTAIGLFSGLLLTLGVKATTFHAAPTGSAGGDGSLASPWDLQTALNQPSLLLPGDTLLLLDGIYTGPFVSELTGTFSNPIVVRQADGARAILQDNRATASGATLQVNGGWTWYMDFEITNINADRNSSSSSIFRPMGIQAQGPGTKFIHLIIHDTGHGIGLWKEAVDAEVYGCTIYHCGNRNEIGSYQTHGHGIYTQNNAGTKVIRHNVLFNQFGFGLHGFPNPGHLRGYAVEENVIFHSGILSGDSVRLSNLLFEHYAPYEADRITLRGNHTYDDLNSFPHTSLYDVDVLLGSASEPAGSLALTDNHFHGNGRAGMILLQWDSAQVTGNHTFYQSGSVAALLPPGGSTSHYSWDANHYAGTLPSSQFTWGANPASDFAGWKTLTGFDSGSDYVNAAPTGVEVFTLPDDYTPGRYLLVVHNWGHAATTSIHPPGMANGQAYEILDLQNILGSPIATGTYDASGSGIELPLNADLAAAPIGWPSVGHTASEFQCFLLKPRLSVATAEAESQASGLQVAPNPSSGRFVVSWESQMASSYRLLDGLGRYLTGPQPIERGVHSAAFDLEQMGPGSYFIEIQTDKGPSRAKLIILQGQK
jgi:hypothetical protein